MKQQFRSQIYTDLEYGEAVYQTVQVYRLLKDDARYYTDNIMTCTKHIELIANVIISYMKAIDNHYQDDAEIIKGYVNQYVKNNKRMITRKLNAS